MKVILLEDVKGKGKKGELIEVSEGYGRNYLLPKKLAQPATPEHISAMRQADSAKQRRLQLEREAALAAGQRLESLVVKIPAKAGVGGKLFGAVTAKEISEALQAQHGIEIAKQKIVLEEPIKQFGTYEIKAKLFPEITGAIHVLVCEG